MLLDSGVPPFRPASLRITSPCREDWNRMSGGERVRFCGSCRQNVYDVSNLSVEQIRRLVFVNEGRLCVRMLARPDGTMVIQGCRARLRALRAKGVLGWIAFLILIVPAAVLSHLLQAAWLVEQTAPRIATPATPLERLPADTHVMGAIGLVKSDAGGG